MDIKSIKKDTHNFRMIFDSVTEDIENEYIFRSDGLYKVKNFNHENLKKLYIIDLRANNEIADKGYQVTDKNTIYKHMSFYGEASSLGHLPDRLNKFRHMGEMYVYMIENFQESIRDILEFIIGVRDGDVLLHCTSGKDRTGIISMLLLEMLGISRDSIVESYALSELNTIELVKEQKKSLEYAEVTVPAFLFDSKAEDMHFLYEFIEEKYGSVNKYIEELGISDIQVEEFNNFVKGNKDGKYKNWKNE